MVNRNKPLGRPTKYVPQTVRLCLHCGGRCVCLPRLGVACLDCHGTAWIPVAEADVEAWREQIVKTREILDAMTPGVTLAEASRLFLAIKNAIPAATGTAG